MVNKWGVACPSSTFAAQGFRRLGQDGYFENGKTVARGVGNTPVVFVELEKDFGAGGGAAALAGLATYAQIDTGYNDSQAAQRRHQQTLRGPAAEAQAEAQAAGFDERPGLRPGLSCATGLPGLPGWRLRIQEVEGDLILPVKDFHFIAKEKQPPQCGGITQDAKPAAQLGASFLRLFGTTVFIPQAKEVWIRPARP